MNYTMWYDKEAEVVRVKVIGKFSPQDNTEFIRRLEGLFKDKDQRVVIIDVSEGNFTIPPREKREKMLKRIKRMEFDRIAFVGASPLIKMMMKIVSITLGRKGSIGSFVTDDEALIWIASQRKTLNYLRERR